jgi:hypothetical protein
MGGDVQIEPAGSAALRPLFQHEWMAAAFGRFVGLSATRQTVPLMTAHAALFAEVKRLRLDEDLSPRDLAALLALGEVTEADLVPSDQGMAGLADAQRLESLSLSGPAVSDAGLRHLAGLRNLVRLRLTDTRVSEAAADGLRRRGVSVSVAP